MIDAEPPESLTLFREGCELCDRGDLEAGRVLLEQAKSLAEESANDSFSQELLVQIHARLD